MAEAPPAAETPATTPPAIAQPPATAPVEAPAPAEAKVRNDSPLHVQPLISLTGSTDAVGTLAFSPALLVGGRSTPRTWAMIAPTIRASTAKGSSTVDLRDVRATPGAAIGGSISVYHHTRRQEWDQALVTDDDILTGIAACDAELEVPALGNKEWKCEASKDPSNGESYCKARKAQRDAGDEGLPQFSSKDMCTQGWAAMARPGSRGDVGDGFTALATQHVITVGALTGPQSFEHLIETDAMKLAETKTRKWDIRAGVQYALLARTNERILDERGKTKERIARIESRRKRLRRFSFTFEATGAFARVHGAAPTSGEWCVQDPRPVATDGGEATVQTCKTTPIGGPVRKDTVEGSLLFGAINVKDQRWRFAVGPHVKTSLTTGTTLVALELPIHIRLTKQSTGPYVGPYVGLVRVRPVVGPEIVGGKVDGVRVLLVLDLLGQNGLWGGQAFSWL